MFEERFVFDPPLVSIERRFPNVSVPDVPIRRQPEQVEQPREAPAASPIETVPVRQPAPRPEPRRPATKLASITPAPLADTVKKSLDDGDAAKESRPSPETDGRTAIYDISAQAVYLPNGKTLEAHSGLGSHMDDPRAINLKGRGPTPPNVYRLAMREKLFHGVRAIRLIPADEDKMFGRDGMLAHTYMLGPNGQSNGCVSLSDYPAFLNAYLNGEIERLVVVERLDKRPDGSPASGWLAEAFGKLFTPTASVRDATSDNRGRALSYQ